MFHRPIHYSSLFSKGIGLFFYVCALCLFVMHSFPSGSFIDRTNDVYVMSSFFIILSALGRFIALCVERYQAKTYVFFDVHWSIDNNGNHCALITGKSNTRTLLTNKEKAPIDAYIRKLEKNPQSYGFLIPLDEIDK